MSLNNAFSNKCVLVTGAGKGIGRALVHKLHSYGAKVYAVSKEPLDILKKECENITAFELDVGDWKKTREIVDNMKDLNVVINNAATTCFMKPFLEITEQEYDNTFNVNLKAVTNISQVAAKNMVSAGIAGSILNISSILSSRVIANASVYNASKAGLDMLTKSMAYELGKHQIRVNAISLGWVQTTFVDRMIQEGQEESMRKTFSPILEKVVYGHEFLPMDEVVNTILFTASDLASSLTGACIVHDGGYGL